MRGRTAALRTAAALLMVAVAWALFTASSIPDLVFLDNELLDTVVRKAGHFAAFFAFGVSAIVALATIGSLPWAAAAAVAAAGAIGTWDELNQTGVAGRMGSPVDVVIDLLGALAAVMLVAAIDRRQRAAADSS